MKASNKKILDKYKSNLNTAYKANYSRNIPKVAVQEMERVYFDETGKSLTTNYSCGGCVLNTLKKIAKLYYGD